MFSTALVSPSSALTSFGNFVEPYTDTIGVVLVIVVGIVALSVGMAMIDQAAQGRALEKRAKIWRSK